MLWRFAFTTAWNPVNYIHFSSSSTGYLFRSTGLFSLYEERNCNTKANPLQAAGGYFAENDYWLMRKKNTNSLENFTKAYLVLLTYTTYFY